MPRPPEDAARDATDAQLEAMRYSNRPDIAEAALREIARRADEEWERNSSRAGEAA